LSKNFAEADKYYHQYKDSSYGGSNTFKEGFLQDFYDFELAGVINKKEKDVYDKVKALREMLEAMKPDKKRR
jgi:hypothetical protein